MLNERPNMPQMESGARLAMRALGWGSIYAFIGVGAISSLIWFSLGAKDVLFLFFRLNLSTKINFNFILQLKDFRIKAGEILPRIPRNEPQGRTEFDSFRDLFTYLSEESDKKKGEK